MKHVTLFTLLSSQNLLFYKQATYRACIDICSHLWNYSSDSAEEKKKRDYSALQRMFDWKFI